MHLGEAKGWIRVTQSKKKHALMLEFTHSLTPVLPALLGRVRALFDLERAARSDSRSICAGTRAWRAAVKANPGMRVPGAFNGFEMGVRAILGQQVTVRAATTIACRFVEAFGEPIVTPFAGTEPAHTRARARRRRERGRHRPTSASSPRAARSIIALAAAQGSGELCLDGGAHHNPGRLHQAAGGAARDRPVDGALHCHARPALAGRVSQGRHRRAQQSRWA